VSRGATAQWADREVHPLLEARGYLRKATFVWVRQVQGGRSECFQLETRSIPPGRQEFRPSWAVFLEPAAQSPDPRDPIGWSFYCRLGAWDPPFLDLSYEIVDGEPVPLPEYVKVLGPLNNVTPLPRLIERVVTVTSRMADADLVSDLEERAATTELCADFRRVR
jgi:hypothetical protein